MAHFAIYSASGSLQWSGYAVSHSHAVRDLAQDSGTGVDAKGDELSVEAFAAHMDIFKITREQADSLEDNEERAFDVGTPVLGYVSSEETIVKLDAEIAKANAMDSGLTTQFHFKRNDDLGFTVDIFDENNSFQFGHYCDKVELTAESMMEVYRAAVSGFDMAVAYHRDGILR